MTTLSCNEASQLLRSFSEISPSTTPTSQISAVNNAPKYGTLIPNRIFVGGIPANTNEQELKHFFDTYGSVKDVKIINDRAGVSKGYGFVTFDAQDIAEKLIKSESENLVFKERKLNIGYAIRKQQVVARSEVPNTVFFTTNGATANSYGSLPYAFQNPMALFHAPGQEVTPGTACTYLPNTPYATMLMQPSVYVPQQHYAYTAPTVPTTTVGANTASQWQATTASVNSNTATAATAAQIAASAAATGQYQWPPGWPVPQQNLSSSALTQPSTAYFSNSSVPCEVIYGIQGHYNTPCSTSEYSSDNSHVLSSNENTTESESSPARMTNTNYSDNFSLYSPGMHPRVAQLPAYLLSASPATGQTATGQISITPKSNSTLFSVYSQPTTMSNQISAQKLNIVENGAAALLPAVPFIPFMHHQGASFCGLLHHATGPVINGFTGPIINSGIFSEQCNRDESIKNIVSNA